MLKTAAVASDGTVAPSVTWTTTWRPALTRPNPPMRLRVSTSLAGVIGVNVEGPAGAGATPGFAATDTW